MSTQEYRRILSFFYFHIQYMQKNLNHTNFYVQINGGGRAHAKGSKDCKNRYI
jgi:hypothetical protein